jgi:hypothetical protein
MAMDDDATEFARLARNLDPGATDSMNLTVFGYSYTFVATAPSHDGYLSRLFTAAQEAMGTRRIEVLANDELLLDFEVQVGKFGSVDDAADKVRENAIQAHYTYIGVDDMVPGGGE